MKRNNLLFVLAIFGGYANGQILTTPTGTIGDNGSADLVLVNGSTKLVNPGGRTLLLEKDNDDSWLTFHDPGDSWYSLGIKKSQGVFAIEPNGVLSAPTFVMNGSGFIGLGKLTPNARLDIHGGGANTTNVILSANYNDRFRWRFNTIDRGNAIDMDFTASDGGDNQETVLTLTRSTSGRPEFQLANNAIVANDGRVGIGITNPIDILQIGNSGNTNQNKIAIPGVYNFENFKMGQFGNGASGIEMVNHTDLNNSFGIKISTNVDQAAGLQIQYAPAASSYGSLQYTTGFFMGYDGRVGIGTTNPDAKLTVKGTIHAEEVKVDLNVPGPDYVFEKDYTLMSLEEIKAFIEKHKHLPEVPSAKEMETNGVNLSEMNMILLKKVEELTLHLIKQDELNKNQLSRIEQLESEMKAIRNR
jgi:hypothetical protein